MKYKLLLIALISYACLSAQVKPDGTVKEPRDVKTPTKTQKTNSTSVGMGISVDLGGLIRSFKKNKNCNQVEIIFPASKSKFIADLSIPPVFRWKSSKADLVASYRVELVAYNGKEKTILYQGETEETLFSWPDEVAWRGDNPGKVKYGFFVMAIASNSEKCGNDVNGIELTVTTDKPIIKDTHADNTTKITSDIKVGYGNPVGGNEQANQNQIVLLTPRNGMSYQIGTLPDFTWRMSGIVENPRYSIEVFEVLSDGKNERIYLEENMKQTVVPTQKVAKFKAGKALADTVKRTANRNQGGENPAAGNYMWKVTETSTGISSAPSLFSVSNCEFDLQITNETIECLGYEGENRKYKICFSSTYQSSTGNLTFANSGSGLFVYHPINNSLNPTNISPSLVTQIGATTSTVSYCFEVTVSASVTSIGFGLQGDDLDLSPVTCQPGASLMFDELPDCICDECEDTELSFDNFNISLNGTSGNQFNFNGNINVNVPIYGIEFQIQSFSYSANPSACSEGISNLEESGMFLMPGTTINGSTSLQLANETASGSASSNDNATKNIKYSSNTALTGAIPVNLTIGLPGPISGLDPSCCVIEYNVCIKVKIFYDDGSCKSCVFTHCFNFNNQ